MSTSWPPDPEPTAMVLLVDDQAIVGEAVRRALAGQDNVDFHFCSEATNALATAERIAPTVILQDLIMPGHDGLALVREYRSHPATRNVPVIVLSSRDEATTKRDAFAAGANDYLVKLPDTIELLARVRHHTMGYISRQQRDEAYHALRQSQRDLLEANFELQRLMNMDGLTGINNRRRFDEYTLVEWRRASRERLPFALLLADVDAFKAYNDTYGHLAGDDVLRQIAQVIQASCKRPADLPARYGGEEFAIVLPSTDSAGAAHIAETFRESIADLAIPHAGSTASDRVTVSVGGAACVPGEAQNLVELMHLADRALYEAKSSGRNRVVIRKSP